MAEKADKTEAAPPQKKVTVTIKKDNHIHAGVAVPKGAKVEVDQARATRMRQAGIVE